MPESPDATDSPADPGATDPRETAAGWHWRDQDGRVVARGFPDQAEAEAWLAESWQDLLTDGVAAVVLHEGDRLVYGPMPLAGDA